MNIYSNNRITHSYTNEPLHPMLLDVPRHVLVSSFKRVFAALIDWLCYTLVLFVFMEVPQVLFGIGPWLDGIPDSLLFVIFLLWRACIIWLFSTTPGLSLYGLRAVSSTDLGPPSLKSLLFRVPFQLLGLLVFTTAFSRHRMTIYDMICNVTYVPEYLLLLKDLSPPDERAEQSSVISPPDERAEQSSVISPPDERAEQSPAI